MLTSASASALSASLLCCNIFCAMTGLAAGLIGGRSLDLRYRAKPGVRVGLVSLDVSLEPVVDRDIPDIPRCLGESPSTLVRLL